MAVTRCCWCRSARDDALARAWRRLDAMTGATALDTLPRPAPELHDAGIQAGPAFGTSAPWAANGSTSRRSWGLDLLVRRIVRCTFRGHARGIAVPAALFHMFDPARTRARRSTWRPERPCSAPSSSRPTRCPPRHDRAACLRRRHRPAHVDHPHVGRFPDGVAFAVLIMNLAVPLIASLHRPSPWG